MRRPRGGRWRGQGHRTRPRRTDGGRRLDRSRPVAHWMLLFHSRHRHAPAGALPRHAAYAAPRAPSSTKPAGACRPCDAGRADHATCRVGGAAPDGTSPPPKGLAHLPTSPARGSCVGRGFPPLPPIADPPPPPSPRTLLLLARPPPGPRAAVAPRRCASLGPDDAPTWLRLGDALQQSSDRAGARAAWGRSAALGGRAAIRRLALADEQDGNLPDAIAVWVRLPPQDPQALAHLGLLALTRRDVETARADFIAARTTPNALAADLADPGF